jgi:hypothetical protein
MEELKLLVEMVASLPSMALWVVAFFFVYKVSIIGSIYGVIRFCVAKLHDWAVTKKTTQPAIEQEINLRDKLHGITITSDNTLAELLGQIRRVGGKAISIDSKYIHLQSVNWLREAIDAKERAEFETPIVPQPSKINK